MDDLIKQWDGESVVVHLDRPTGAWIVIAVHSTRLGPAAGGTRMKVYPSLETAMQDALKLAGSMTLKFALAGMPFGGGKAVIALPPDFDRAARPALLRRYGQLIHQLGGLYRTGPDVGTGPEDMDVISETGAPFVFSRTVGAGGAGDSAPATALGVFHGISVLSESLFGVSSLKGRQILVQGAGSVGRRLIDLLCGAGASVTYTDILEGAAKLFSDKAGLKFVSPDHVYDVECDIFSPCALGGTLDQSTIARLRCRGICGCANNQLASPDDAERLQRRGLVYAPDFVVNVGGAMAITGMEQLGWTREDADRRVARAVEQTLKEVLSLSAKENITTDAAARRIAQDRLARSAQEKGAAHS